VTGPLRRLFGRNIPAEVAAGLGADEAVLAVAGELVATSLGLWLPEGAGHRRVGWHLVSKAVWRDGALTVTVAGESGGESGIVLLHDLPPRRFELPRPGKLPAMVRKRVTGAIVSTHYRELPGGGARVVQRRVSGSGEVFLQLRADPGTDQDAVRELAREIARGLDGPSAR
jgi:hypothetical protein